MTSCEIFIPTLATLLKTAFPDTGFKGVVQVLYYTSVKTHFANFKCNILFRYVGCGMY